jgi:hypothetical protein
MSSFFNEYLSQRFPLPSSEKNGVVVEKDADITCDISNYINIINDFVNTYEYDISVERLNSYGELKGSTDSPPTIVPYSILENNLLNNKKTHTREKIIDIMNKLFVLEEDDRINKIDKRYPINVFRPINLDIIDVLFDETFFNALYNKAKGIATSTLEKTDDLPTKNYTPEEKEALKACLKVELEDINHNLTTSKLIEFVPDPNYFVGSLTGATGVIARLIKQLRDRMNRKLMIHQSINRPNVEEEKKNEKAFIKQQKEHERQQRLAKINEEREIREEEHEERMKNDEEYRNRIERIEEREKASNLFRKQEFRFLKEKTNKEGRIRSLAKKYDEEYNNAIRNIRTDHVLDTRITDEDAYNENEKRIEIKINDFNNKENNFLKKIKEKYNIAEPITSDKVKAHAYDDSKNIDVYGTELNGGKSKKTCKNRKRKKCRKTNKKQKKKSLGYRKNKGRKSRRK